MMRSDLWEIVREANPVEDPVAAVDPVVRTATLQRALASEADPGPHVAQRRRLRLPLLGILAPLLVAGAALAATTLLTGAPYRAPWEHRGARSDMGVPIAASIRLLSLRVPDPAGGPPWGMRVMRTTRGDECMQIGRVVRGRLGVLGQDGIFGGDHRFHPLPPSAFADFDCALVGSGGYAVVGNWINTHASGIEVVGTCAYPGPGSKLPVCPAGDLRFIAYGLVGPHARAITVKDGRTVRAIAPVAPQGAYLVVRRVRKLVSATPTGASAGGAGLAGGGGPGSFPGAVAIVYRDGRVCPTPDPPGNATCAYEDDGSSVPVHLRLRTVRVRVSGVRVDPSFSDHDRAVLHFAAPVGVTTGALDYAVVARNPGMPVTATGGALDRDVRKGAPVDWTVDVPRCTRTVRLRLYLGRSTPLSLSGHGLPSRVATLANLTLRLPRARPPAWCKGPPG